jgi:acetate kinase
MILVVNAGSSSLKLRLLDDADAVARTADLPAGTTGFDQGRLAAILHDWPVPEAVGHRVVHGGASLRGPARIDADLRAQLSALVDLAPLHQPKSLLGIDAVTELLPAVPAVACFDTAFHATMPPEAYTYAIPRLWREQYHIRRYGFHGLSHAYCARRVTQILTRPATGLRIVSCHLGAGASVAAILDGRSIDTSMGFTPLEGLVMATRSGSVDPGLVLWLAEHEHLAPHEIADALENQSGLLGLAGTADMQEVIARAHRRDGDAALALDVYGHHLGAGIAAMAAALGGIDVLAFTGGVGENSAAVRSIAAARLGFLGIEIDTAANGSRPVDLDISAPGAAVRTVVVAAREDIEIAREVRAVLG